MAQASCITPTQQVRAASKGKHKRKNGEEGNGGFQGRATCHVEAFRRGEGLSMTRARKSEIDHRRERALLMANLLRILEVAGEELGEASECRPCALQRKFIQPV